MTVSPTATSGPGQGSGNMRHVQNALVERIVFVQDRRPAQAGKCGVGGAKEHSMMSVV